MLLELKLNKGKEEFIKGDSIFLD